MKQTVWLVTFLLTFIIQTAYAESKEVLNIKIYETIKMFDKEVKGGTEFLNRAKGYLVFPSVYKAGFGIGGEYGEGGLIVNNKIIEYYRTITASIGFQIGAQKKSIIIVFLTQRALDEFRNSDGWKVGVDGSVAIVKWGVGEEINSIEFNKPIIGFIFGNKGLMYNLTLEGSKITKMRK